MQVNECRIPDAQKSADVHNQVPILSKKGRPNNEHICAGS